MRTACEIIQRCEAIFLSKKCVGLGRDGEVNLAGRDSSKWYCNSEI